MIPALLALAVAAAALTAAGLVCSRNIYRRLHFLAPAATVGVAAVAAAILLQEGLGEAGRKALFAGAVVFVMNPILTHVTARAARTHQRGRWDR